VHQRRGDEHLLLHAFRELAEALIDGLRQVEAIEHLLDSVRGAVLRQVVERRDQLEVLPRRQRLVQRRGFRDVADALLDLERLGHDVEAGHGGPSAIGLDHAGENLDGGRFPGPVGTEKAEDLTGGDAQVEAVQSHPAAIAAPEVVGFDHEA
jgi:hypothetical protein